MVPNNWRLTFFGASRSRHCAEVAAAEETHQESGTPSQSTRGRVDADCRALAGDLGAGCLSVFTLVAVVNKGLTSVGLDSCVGREWVRGVLQSMNFSFKKIEPLSKLITPEEQDAAQHHLRLGVAYLRWKHDIAWDRIVNLDRTSIRLLRSPDHSWSPTGQQAARCENSRSQITGCIGISTVLGKICCLLIVKGKTKRVSPPGPYPPRHMCDIDDEPLEQSVVNARIPVGVGC